MNIINQTTNMPNLGDLYLFNANLRTKYILVLILNSLELILDLNNKEIIKIISDRNWHN